MRYNMQAKKQKQTLLRWPCCTIHPKKLALTSTTSGGRSLRIVRSQTEVTKTKKLNSVTLVRERTIPTKRPPLVGEVNANFCGCSVVSATDPHGRSLCFIDRSRYCLFQVAPHLYSRGWVDPVPDPLLLRKSGSAANRTRDLWICSQELWPQDHRGGQWDITLQLKL
jgi:hypothetical protein